MLQRSRQNRGRISPRALANLPLPTILRDCLKRWFGGTKSLQNLLFKRSEPGSGPDWPEMRVREGRSHAHSLLFKQPLKPCVVSCIKSEWHYDTRSWESGQVLIGEKRHKKW